jgi:hypothetical protein
MRHAFFLFLIILFYSCTDEYRLRSMDDSSILVIDGCITNEEGPYRINVSKCVANLSSSADSFIRFPVMNAQVSITDDLGHRDELKPLWKERVVTVEKPDFIDNNGDTVFFASDYLLLPKYDGSYDSLYHGYGMDYFFNGIYYTTAIVGAPGRSYTLTVEHEGRTYTATDKMPFGTVLDSVVLKPEGIGLDGKSGQGFDVPFLSFAEPQDQVNYYIFTASVLDSAYRGMGKLFLPEARAFNVVYYESLLNTGVEWPFYMVSDKFMFPYMTDFKMNDGTSVRSWYSGTDEGWGGGWASGYMDVYMLSVSRPAYQYYVALRDQFYQDGGAFSPAPASPPTNVSNGGQGFFMAISVASCRSNRRIINYN